MSIHGVNQSTKFQLNKPYNSTNIKTCKHIPLHESLNHARSMAIYHVQIVK